MQHVKHFRRTSLLGTWNKGIVSVKMTEFSKSMSEIETLSFWTGSSTIHCSLFDQFTAGSVGDLEYLENLPNWDVNSSNRCQWTVLMYAAYYDHTEVVNYLQCKGVNVRSKNDKGRTSLMMAAMCGNEAVIQTLLSCVKDKELLQDTDNIGYTPLFHAASNGHSSVTHLLLDMGSNPNVVESERGYSPLLLAAAEGHELVVQWLVKFGADVNYKTILGDSARSIAVKRGHERIARFISKVQKALLAPSVLDGPAKAAQLMLKRSMQGETTRVMDLETFLGQLGLGKYLALFQEQEIDFTVFLTLNDNDLKNIGVSLLGPRRKMTSAIARWLNEAPVRGDTEQAYANKLNAEVFNMATELKESQSKIKDLQDKLDKSA